MFWIAVLLAMQIDCRDGATTGFGLNNPCNLRGRTLIYAHQSGSRWGFMEFENLYGGYRAALLNVKYHVKNGANTPRKIGEKLSPSFENETHKLVKLIEKHTGLKPDEPIKENSIPKIVYACSIFETGRANEIVINIAWNSLRTKK